MSNVLAFRPKPPTDDPVYFVEIWLTIGLSGVPLVGVSYVHRDGSRVKLWTGRSIVEAYAHAEEASGFGRYLILDDQGNEA